MRARNPLIALLAVASFVLVACSGGKESTPAAAAAAGELPASATETLARVLNEYDEASLNHLLAANARIMPANVPTIEGRDAILAYYKVSVTPQLHWELTKGKTATFGNAGLAEGTYRIKNTGTGQYVESGKYLSVWINEGGAWKILRFMSSPDHEVAQASVEVTEHGPAEAPKKD